MSSDTHFVSICAVRRRQQAVAEKCDGHSTARLGTTQQLILDLTHLSGACVGGVHAGRLKPIYSVYCEKKHITGRCDGAPVTCSRAGDAV